MLRVVCCDGSFRIQRGEIERKLAREKFLTAAGLVMLGLEKISTNNFRSLIVKKPNAGAAYAKNTRRLLECVRSLSARSRQLKEHLILLLQKFFSLTKRLLRSPPAGDFAFKLSIVRERREACSRTSENVFKSAADML